MLQNKNKFWGDNYTYDPWGNLTNKTTISTACAGELLSAPALTNNQLSGYGYDAAGNMTSDPTDNVTSTYDAENRIATANTPQGVFTYTYDANGNRVEKSGGGSGTLYWYMTPGIVAESDPAGNLKSEYVFFNGERVARKDFDPSTHAPTGVFYYFSDHLKTASVITDSAGNIKSESDYYPWGGELQFVNNDSNHYKFTGKERDTESGLDYFGARYYSNGLGRFITPDWAAKAVDVPYAEFSDPQSLNLYSYVRDLPTTRADIDGHQGPSGQNDFGPVCNFCMDGPMWLLNQILPGNPISAAYFQNSQNKTPPPPPPATPANGSKTSQSTPADPNQQKPQKESNQKETQDQSEEKQTVRRVSNPKHNPNSASPEPKNVQQLFEHSIEDKNGVRWAKDSDGTIHRFSKPSNGESHWNGSTKGSNGIRTEDIPIEIRRALK